MTPFRAQVEGHLARALREALESVASPDLASRLLSMSLVAAGRTSVPEDPKPFARFVEADVRRAVMDTIGASSYDVLAQQLRHVLVLAESQVKRPHRDDEELSAESSSVRAVDELARRPIAEIELATRRSSDSGRRHRPAVEEPSSPSHRIDPSLVDTHRAEPASEPPITAELPIPDRDSAPMIDTSHLVLELDELDEPTSRMQRSGAHPTPRPQKRESRPGEVDTLPPLPAPRRVLIATLDLDVVRETAAKLGERSQVVQVLTLDELLRHAVASTDAVIVLDAALPSVDPPSVASAAYVFPPGTKVVLWGVTEKQRARLASLFAAAESWIALGATTSLAEAFDEL